MSEAIAPAPSAPAAPAAPEPSQPAPSAPNPDNQVRPGELTNPKTTDTSDAPLKPNKAELRKTAAQALRERFEGKDKPRAEPEKQGDDKGKGEPPKEAAQRGQDGKFAPKAGDAPAEPSKGEPAPAPAPQQPPKPADNDHEIKLARAIRGLNEKTAEAETHRRKLQETSAELTKLQKKLEAGKANPLDVLEELGWDYGRLTEAVVARKVQPRAQRMELPPEMLEKIERLEAAEKQREVERQQHVARQQREADVGVVRNYLQGNAERYPFAASLDWAAGAIVDNAMRANAKNAEPYLQALERELSASTAALLGNERVVKALLASNPKIKETLSSILGSTSNPAKPAASNGAGKVEAGGPPSIANLPSGETATPPTKQSKAQRKRDALRAWDERRQQTG